MHFKGAVCNFKSLREARNCSENKTSVNSQTSWCRQTPSPPPTARGLTRPTD